MPNSMSANEDDLLTVGEVSTYLRIGQESVRRWLREGKRQLERHRWQHPDPIPRERAGRLLLAAGRLQSDLEIEQRANAAYEHYRSTARDKLGRRLSRPPNPYHPPALPAGRVNLTDPDSKSLPLCAQRNRLPVGALSGH